MVVHDSGDEDADGAGPYAVFEVDGGEVSYFVTYDTWNFAPYVTDITNWYGQLYTVEKVWEDVGEDRRPDAVDVQLQRERGDSWVAVETARLSEENNWQAVFAPSDDDDDERYINDDGETPAPDAPRYRVRAGRAGPDRRARGPGGIRGGRGRGRPDPGVPGRLCRVAGRYGRE